MRDVFLFIAAILSMIATTAIVHIVCKHAKLKALLKGIASQPMRETDAIFGAIVKMNIAIVMCNGTQ